MEGGAQVTWLGSAHRAARACAPSATRRGARLASLDGVAEKPSARLLYRGHRVMSESRLSELHEGKGVLRTPQRSTSRGTSKTHEDRKRP
ncbi:hypothetical protein MRX96_024575 [Rhipicephalus microplus]